jgi:hypothetical protein
MSLLSLSKKRVRALMPLVLALAVQQAALADDACGPSCGAACGTNCTTSCNTHCSCFHCPPCFRHCTEGPPKIKFKCGCGKPVCVPDCSTPNYGYFATCWRSWPSGANDYSHCPCATPGALAAPCGTCTVPGMPAARPGPGEAVPPPQPVDSGVRQSL